MALMSKPPIVIIDGMNAAYRAFHSHGGLSNSRGESVALIYGFLNILQSIKKTFEPKKLVIAWDGKKSAERLAIHPEYKSNRSKLGFDVEDFYSQRDRVRKMIYYLGVPQLHHEDIEADDYICKYVDEMVPKVKRKIVIVSGDKDFGQLISKQVLQYIPSRNKLYNPLNFKTDNGHRVDQVVDFLCLTGDKSDNIPGYGGIGEVRANEFLKRHSSIDAALSKDEIYNFDKEKLLQVYTRNRKLIDLRLFNDMHLKNTELRYYKDKKNPVGNFDTYKSLCKKAEIKTFATNQFLNLFI